MNPRAKHLFHEKLIDTLANSYSANKLQKILSQYFTAANEGDNPKEKKLYSKIGELQVLIDFLKKVLGK